MKFIGINTINDNSSQLLDELAVEKEIVITSNNKPMAIVFHISDQNLEETLHNFRKAKAITAVFELQQKSTEIGTDTITLDEINTEIQSERKNHSLS